MLPIFKDTGRHKVRERKRFNPNIGTVIFGLLFVYLIIMIIVYLLTDHVSSYMVTSGALSGNDTYTALALRQEQIVLAPGNGYVNYYILDSAKAGKDAVVCSISGTRNETASVRLSEADLDAVRRIASQYSSNYTSDEYRRVYDLKYSVNASIVNNSENGLAAQGTVSLSPSDGIISYIMDGKESLTEENLTADDFKKTAANTVQLRTDKEIQAGEPLYRVINSEHWEVVFPINDRQYSTLSSRSTVRVRFAKDGYTETGDLKLFDLDGKHYAAVTFSSGMVRYCNERYLDIELVTNTQSGLKVPLSAIVTKEFYTIPASYLSSGGDRGADGFLVREEGADGNFVTSFIEAELYELAVPPVSGNIVTDPEEVYYVDPQVFHRGDVVIRPNSTMTYTIGETASLEGVYCTNRGYAVFRKIEMIDQNEDYCIVRSNTSYGLSQYDYIVRNGTDVKEEQIVSGTR